MSAERCKLCERPIKRELSEAGCLVSNSADCVRARLAIMEKRAVDAERERDEQIANLKAAVESAGQTTLEYFEQLQAKSNALAEARRDVVELRVQLDETGKLMVQARGERDAARADEQELAADLVEALYAAGVPRDWQPAESPVEGVGILAEQRDEARDATAAARETLDAFRKMMEHEEPYRARLNELTVDMNDAPPFILQRATILIDRLIAAIRKAREIGSDCEHVARPNICAECAANSDRALMDVFPKHEPPLHPPSPRRG